MATQRVKVRTAPAEHEIAGVPHVFITGAPPHYVPGYGYMTSPEGTVILLDTDNPDPEKAVKAGKWLQRVNPKDAEKVALDPEKGPELAEKAADAKAADLAKETAAVPVSDDAAARQQADSRAQQQTKPTTK